MNAKQKETAQGIADRAYKYIKRNSAKYPCEDYNVYVDLIHKNTHRDEMALYIKMSPTETYEITIYECKQTVSPLSYWTYSGHYGG
jgi:hypothetical protein